MSTRLTDLHVRDTVRLISPDALGKETPPSDHARRAPSPPDAPRSRRSSPAATRACW